jgi:hypothetical protein
MTPGHLKAAAIAFALLSLTLLAVAAGQWSSDRAGIEAAPEARGAWRGNLILFVVSLGLLGGLLGLSYELGWNRDRVLWVGLGNFLALMTLIRPWWFWENWKARWLRNSIGDAPTALFYLAVSGVMVWVGLYTDWTFGRH